MKDTIIKGLLDFGKKHKLFVYPTLALVGIISAISYLFSWSKGNGKKLVATIVVLALLLSQSIFLTSSASTGLVDSNDVNNTQGPGEATGELVQTDGEGFETYNITYHYNGDQTSVSTYKVGDGELQPGDAITLMEVPASNNDHYENHGWYSLNDYTGTNWGNSYNVPETPGDLHFYAEPVLCKYDVVITNAGESTDTVTDTVDCSSLIGSNGKLDTSLSIPYTFDVSGYSRVGHEFNGVRNSQGQFLSVVDGIASTTLSGNTQSITFDVCWRAEGYPIYYKLNDSDKISDLVPADQRDSVYEGTHTYNAVNTLEDNRNADNSYKFTKRGFKLVGWTTNSDGSGTVYPVGTNVNNLLYGENNSLYAVWEYAYYGLNLDSAEFTYDTPGSYDIMAEYTNYGSQTGDFAYTISNSMNDALAQLGLSADIDETNGKVVISGTPTTTTALSNVCSNGVFPLEITVDDVNNPGHTEVETINITIGKKELTITGVSDSSKTYNGDNKISVGEIYFEGQNDDDDIYISCSNQMGYFDDANVGTKNFELRNLTINSSTSNSSIAAFYTVPENVSLEGNIVQRNVNINTKALYSNFDGYILRGEADSYAGFAIELADNNSQEGIIGDTSSLTSDDLISILGITGFTARESQDSEPGTYPIGVVAAGNSNYKVTITSKGDLVVKQEEPQLDVNYVKGGEALNDGWYSLLSLSPKTGEYYDKIKFADGDWTNALEITQEDYLNNEDGFSIQLYNSTTGAYTTVGTVDTVLVDDEAPSLLSFTVSENDIGVLAFDSTYFPSVGRFLSFGNYFKKAVNVNMSFEDLASGSKTLYYDVAGNGTYVEKTIVDDKATFEIPLFNSESGNKIAFYIVDVAGNSNGSATEPNLLYRESEDEEWLVENHGPDVNIGFRNDRNVLIDLSTDSNYYCNGTVVVGATDEASGIYGIRWTVNGVTDEEITPVSTRNSKVTNTTFEKAFDESGEYIVSAIVYDNADNSSVTNEITIRVDNDKPVITIEDDDDSWVTSKTVEFTVSDELSGVRYATVKDSANNVINCNYDEATDKYTVTFTDKGSYKFMAYDNAGNEEIITKTYTKISDTIPSEPEVYLDPEDSDGSNNWYINYPTLHIVPADNVDSDTTPVYTYYKIWRGEEEAINATMLEDDFSYNLNRDGLWHIKVWSVSASDVQCQNVYEETVYVDTTNPEIEIVSATSEENKVKINFTAKDLYSGIDPDSIKVTCNGINIGVTVNASSDGNGYVGVFDVDSRGTYYIYAKDLAGNEIESLGFEPMSMRIKAVSDITNSSAKVSAIVYKGTSEIRAVRLMYKTFDSEEYVEVTPNIVRNDDDSVSLSYIFEGLTTGTVYNYKIVADSNMQESLNYVGSFRTIDESETGISVQGTARYNNAVSDDIKSNDINVLLYNNTTCVRSVSVADGGTFTFGNVPDGSYSIVAISGNYEKVVGLVIEDGNIASPQGNINIVLGGQSTGLVISGDGTPNVTVSGLDDIFQYDSTNYSSDDQLVVDEGGVVEYKLYVSLKKVAEVDQEEISAMYGTISDKKVVGAYIDLSLYKITTLANGVTLPSERIDELAGGVKLKVTVPLGDMAGKDGLGIVMIHHQSDNSYSIAELKDVDNNKTTYSFETNKFSTYAFVYTVSDETKNETNNNGGQTIGEIVDKKEPTSPEVSSTIKNLSQSSQPQTGDNEPIALYVSLIAVLGISIVLISIKKKNKNSTI